MKRQVLAIALIIGILFLVGCGQNTDGSNLSPAPSRLEGYYLSNFVDGTKYKFEITDIASGDYGGEVTDMNNTNVIYSYYVIGNEVYIDGTLRYLFVDAYLVCINEKTGLQVDTGNQITGQYEKVYVPEDYSASKGMQYNFSGNGSLKQTYYYMSRPTNSWQATYTVNGNIVTVSSDRGTDQLFMIYNNAVYPILVRI